MKKNNEYIGGEEKNMDQNEKKDNGKKLLGQLY